MLRIVMANVLLLGFLLIEVLLRKNGEASDLTTDTTDKGSTRLIGLLYAGAIILLILVSIINIGFFNNAVVGIIGQILMGFGILFRIWSMQILGRFYSRTLRVIDDQQVISNGPYRYIRHPGYLSSIIFWIGSGLAFENLILIIVFPILFVTVYIYRIIAEERMLISQFGEDYLCYQKKTWRLIPFLF